jgi:putative transposase
MLSTTPTGFPVDSADLLYRKGSFWLHVVVTIPTPDITDNGEAVGVVLGLTHPSGGNEQPAVSRQEALERKEVDRKYFRMGRALHACPWHKIGSQASSETCKAGRKLPTVSARQTDCDHVLSKRIVSSVVNPGTTIVLENLTDCYSQTDEAA